jgi:DNA-directed RNA polymerase specialized sigma24 family protein
MSLAACQPAEAGDGDDDSLYFLDRPVAEITEALRVPEVTVKVRAYYAVRQLRALMEPH